ncbi:gastrula zinc finger protein XlCGF57.1-like [Syngnathus typhle]|uniref:gastrula zinc finger protein XlCGF57.1-like n=1 Tax=Syngnathus typhle TaxID=161592 RepID=UPI002A6B15C9|nr:gastrula zinc finger protein XlCGF57.1-like [Syngnathus typhle]XP_061138003.1 gastrula zinc finger protein XlCGF57.1-like [Syngnathus typhle]XP_061138004.1 gastrula zinc finger protein XlCGF57.1-like [Syngnathus typhle]
MFARTTAKYVEEKDRGPQRLEDVWLQPYVVLHRVDLSEAIRPERQEQERIRIKREDVGKEVHHLNEQMEQTFLCTIKEEEPELPCNEEEREDSCNIKEEGEDSYDIKKEEEEEEICKVPLTGVFVTSLDEGQHEFPRREHLKRHTRIRTGGKSFACSVCGQILSNKRNLKNHTTIHTGEKPFSCLFCGKRFSVKRYITLHTRVHTGEKNFSCSVCGKKFSQGGYLKTHTIIHTGEKPFSCTVCGKTFSLKGNLTAHTRIHSGEKRFSCSVCGKKFTLKVNLKSHTKIHTRSPAKESIENSECVGEMSYDP